MLNALLSRWAQTRASQTAADAPTILAHPNEPTQKTAGNDSLWQTLRRRSAAAASQGQKNAHTQAHTQAHSQDQTASQRLQLARDAFDASLDGLQGDAIDALRQRIRRSHSLSDLWHLRGGLFTALARARSQRDAERQLALLHPHFATLQGQQAAPRR